MTADPFLTISGSPGLYYDPTLPHLGSVATLTLVPEVQVFTADDAPGAELVDALLSMLLGHGFALATELGPTAFSALPAPAGWTVSLPADRSGLEVAAGPLSYDGDVGPAAPPGWFDAVVRLDALVVLVASGIDLRGADRTSAIDRARASGRLVGARVGLLAR